MPSLGKKAASALLMAGAVNAQLAIITPCPAAPTDQCPDPITVTAQYQPVSTCDVMSACMRGSCITKFPYATYAYCNTVIPCGWDGDSCQSTTTVTDTCAPVTVAYYESTITSYETCAPVTVTPTPTGSAWGDWDNWVATTITPAPIPHYTTVVKECVAAYESMGPLAIPGWGGSDLCEECLVQDDGAKYQTVNVTECIACEASTACKVYQETWVSSPAPTTTTVYAATCSSVITAPTAGPYTCTFTSTCPGTTIIEESNTYIALPSPYYMYYTQDCYAGQVWDFTAVLSATLTFNFPCETAPIAWTSNVPLPTGSNGEPYWPYGGNNGGAVNGGGWANWSPPTSTPPPPPPQPTNGVWGNWNSYPPPPATSTAPETLVISGSVTSTIGLATTTSPVTVVISGSVTSTVEPTTTAAPGGNPFVLQLNVPTGQKRFHKRQSSTLFLACPAGGSGDCSTTTDPNMASYFTLDSSNYLRLGQFYVGADASSGSAPFEVFTSPPGDLTTFIRNTDGSAYIPGVAGECVRDNVLFVFFNGSDRQSDCIQVTISAPSSPSPTSSVVTVSATTTFSVTNTISVTTTTNGITTTFPVTTTQATTSEVVSTSTADISGNTSFEPPTSTTPPQRRGVIYGGHFQHQHQRH